MQKYPVTTKNIPFPIFFTILFVLEYKYTPFLVSYTYRASPYGRYKVRFLVNMLQKRNL